MEIRHQTYHIGNLPAQFMSDFENGEYLDTRVFLERGTLCYIAGCDIEKFLAALNDIIQKYRI